MTTRTLAVFGVSGRTGRAIVQMADSRWRIRGFVRPGSEVSGVDLVVGTFTDGDLVARVVAGASAVCCVFGPRPPYRDVFCEAATRTVIAAMQAEGCDRLVCQTGAMIGSAVGLRRTRPFQLMADLFARRRPEVARDRSAQEEAVMQSRLRWTIVKPPRLNAGPPLGRVLAAPDLRVGLRSSICRADLAAFLLEEIEKSAFLRRRVVVKGA